jgi:hypothetical protein
MRAESSTTYERRGMGGHAELRGSAADRIRLGIRGRSLPRAGINSGYINRPGRTLFSTKPEHRRLAQNTRRELRNFSPVTVHGGFVVQSRRGVRLLPNLQ